MQNSIEETQRCPQIYVSPTSKYQFSERHGKQYTTHMVFEGELAVKLHVKDVEVGTSSNRNPRHNQVTIGIAYTVLDLLTTKA